MTDTPTLARDLGGKWHRSYGAAPCPVCQPERRKSQNALTLADGTDGRLLLHCKKSNCAFVDILAAAGLDTGTFPSPDPATVARRERKHRLETEKRARQAAAIWREAQPITGTIAESYLRGRGITCPLPETLRFHPACWHPSAKRIPAMVALVEASEGFAVHRTYVRPDGVGKAAIDPAKAMLGAVARSAVRLSDSLGPLVVCEGVETGLSLLSGLLDVPHNVWAALSTSGIKGLRLPPTPGELIIAADGDEPGREAATALARTAHALGWQVSLMPAPEGQDWNDVLQSEVAA